MPPTIISSSSTAMAGTGRIISGLWLFSATITMEYWV
jgi:hypothetical protein